MAISFEELRAANKWRQTEFYPSGKLTLSFRGNELAGEVGEACNIIKKIEREALGMPGSRATIADLADELADIVICADLAAMDAGIDLAKAVEKKFNATSEKLGLWTRVPLAKAEVAHKRGRKLVVVVNGRPRSGKDTFVAMLSDVLEAQGWATASISSIDPVRNALREMGVPVDLKTAAERDLMAGVKASLEEYGRWATKACMGEALAILGTRDEESAVAFLHVREPDAIRYIAGNLPENTDFLSIIVERPGTDYGASNSSDANVEGYPYDIRIRNGGTLDDLSRMALSIAHHDFRAMGAL